MKKHVRYLLLIASCILCSSIKIIAQNIEEQDSSYAVSLNEVVVTAANITNNATGYCIRLTNEPISKGKNTKELLGYLPNISIESETIKINGVEASCIYIDGRKIANMDELSSISADMISSIDVKYISEASQITNSAGGVIYVKLKKIPSMGYYGNLQGSLNFAERNGAYKEDISGVICARVGRLSIYESPRATWMNNKEWSMQSFSNDKNTFYLSLLDHGKYWAYSNTLSLNTEINNSNSIGISWALSRNSTNTENIDQETTVPNLLTRTRGLHNYIIIKYNGDINSQNRITISGEWMNRDYNQIQKNFLDDNETESLLDQRVNMYQLNIDYEHRFTEQLFSNMGITYKGIDLRSNIKKTNSAICYSQDILAVTPLVYFSLQGNVHRVNFYGALNWQLNAAKISHMKSIQQNTVNPNIQISYPFGSRNQNQNQMMLIYKHILDNIPYDALTDNIIWSDSYNYSVGNPNLKAPTEHYLSFVLGLLNNMLNLSASYTHDLNTIYWQSFTDVKTGINHTRPTNLSGINSYALRAEFNKLFFKYWTFKVIARLSFNTEKNILGDVFFNTTRIRQYYSLSNSLNLNKGWGGIANFFIEPCFKYFDRRYHTVYQLDLGMYKTFLNNRLQVIATCSPWGKRRILDRHSDNQFIRLKYTTPIMQGGLRIVWYFNGGKKDIRVNVNQTTLNYQEVKDNI